MKIGIVTWRLDFCGGSEKQVVELALELQQQGHEVRVYAAYCDPQRCYPERLQQLKTVKYLHRSYPFASSTVGRIRSYLATIGMQRRLAQLIDDDLDVVNCHEYRVFPAGIRYRRRTGVPMIGMVNDSPAYAGVQTWRQHPLKFAVTWLKRRWFGASMRAADRITVLSRFVQQQLEQYCRVDNAAIVHSGLDLTGYPWSPKAPVPDAPLQILSVGNFFPWRRYEDLVQALALLHAQGRAFHLHHIGSAAGDLPYAARIRNLVAHTGLAAHVTFHGATSEAEHTRQLIAADVLVLPNHPQTWSLIVFEVMAIGRPVILTATCGAAEVLTDGVDALFVPPYAPQAIAGQLQRLMDDPALRTRLSIAGRALVEAHITWTQYAHRLVRLYTAAQTGAPCNRF